MCGGTIFILMEFYGKLDIFLHSQQIGTSSSQSVDDDQSERKRLRSTDVATEYTKVSHLSQEWQSAHENTYFPIQIQ